MTALLRRELEQLVDGYTAMAGEESTLIAIRRAAQDPADVFSASTFDPGHFTVSAFITDPAGTRLVLVLHSRVGTWLQPGGHIEPHDASLRSALSREVEEEVGLADLCDPAAELFDVDVHGVPAHGAQPAHRHFDLRFHLVTSRTDLEPDPGGDEVRWVSLDDLDARATDHSVVRAVRKLRRQRL